MFYFDTKEDEDDDEEKDITINHPTENFHRSLPVLGIVSQMRLVFVANRHR